MPRYAWGIDIGDGTLKAVRVKTEGRNLCVVRMVEIPYVDPFLKQKSLPSALDRRAMAALMQFGSTVKISETDKVAVCFPSFHAEEGVLETPRLDDSQKKSMIEYEISSAVNVPVQDLAIQFKHHGFASDDMEHILYHAVKRAELDFFLDSLKESSLPYDIVTSPGAALVKMAEIAGVVHSQFLVISFGFSASVLVAVRKSDFWSRTLPLNLPVAPGRTIEVARDKVNEICEILANEIVSFTSRIFPDGSFQPAKILISGEGARIAPLVNTLDFTLTSPVEVLRPSNRVRVDPTFEGASSEKTIQSMGKALGLAAGALDEAAFPCPLAEPVAGRRILRERPLLLYLAGIVILLVLGMGVLERIRSDRLADLEASFSEVPPSDRSSELETLTSRTLLLRKEVAELNGARSARAKFKNLGRLLSRFETDSPQGTMGDFHMTELEIDFDPQSLIQSRIGTRRGNEKEIRAELIDLFEAAADSPRLSGPYPAEEETPPKGMAPLVIYAVEGDLK